MYTPHIALAHTHTTGREVRMTDDDAKLQQNVTANRYLHNGHFAAVRDKRRALLRQQG